MQIVTPDRIVRDRRLPFRSWCCGFNGPGNRKGTGGTKTMSSVNARGVTSSDDGGLFRADDVDFEQLIRGIRAGKAAYMRRFDEILSPGVLFLLARALPDSDLAAKVHGVVLAVMRRIRDGELGGAGGLLPLVRSVAQEHIAMNLELLSRAAAAEPGTPEPVAGTISAPGECETEMMRQVLEDFAEAERIALRRAYVLGESEETILEQTGLTQVRFRQLKTAVKARFLALHGAEAQEAAAEPEGS